MAVGAIGLIDEPGTSEYAPRTSHRSPSMCSRISGSSGRTSDKGESAMKRKIAYSAAVLLLLVVGVAWAQRTDVSRLFPIYNNGGKPDLTVDPKRFISQMEIVDRFFDSSSCELIEGSIGGTGYRRLLRFDTVLINGGDGDLLVGSPTDPNNPYHSVFIYSPCHMHYHISGFSDYKVLNLDRTIAAVGHKKEFWLEDLLQYTNDNKNRR